MIRVARSAFMFGSMLLIGGVLWAAIIFKGFSDIWPTVLDKPFTASAVAVLGVILIRLSRKVGQGANDAAPQTVPRTGVEAKTGLTKSDFHDLLPAMPSFLRRSSAVPAPLVDPRPIDDAPATAPEQAKPDEDTGPGPATIAMAVFQKMQQEARRPTALTAGRMAFRVSLSRGEGQSWIGGAPHMPDTMPWPDLGGRPAAFLAQIALGDLGPDIWAGLGPREGWLLLFSSASIGDGVVALHSHEPGQLRTAPDGAASLISPKGAEARLADLIGPDATVAPRWPLDAAPMAGLPKGQTRSGRARAVFLDHPHLDDPALYPFDWVSAFALLDALSAALRRDLRQWDSLQADRLDLNSARQQREARLMSIAKLRLLARQTEARAETTAFDEDEADDLLSALADLTTAGWESDDRPRSLMSLGLFRGYKAVLETYARRLYAAEPDRLPKSLRRALMPVWQQECEHPALVLGGAVDLETVVLATLNPDAMTGWNGTLRGPLRITLPRAALQDGDFGAARLVQPRSTRTDPTE